MKMTTKSHLTTITTNDDENEPNQLQANGITRRVYENVTTHK